MGDDDDERKFLFSRMSHSCVDVFYVGLYFIASSYLSLK